MKSIIFIFSLLYLSGCSVLSDYYYEDCAISHDYFKSLDVNEQQRLIKKCGGPPSFKLVEPSIKKIS